MASHGARVSLSMIVRDEEHNLEECLSPVAGMFDEIVIVDTGSRDRTKEIAHRFTPHVHDFGWCDDFSAARNECLRHTTGDWIFWLDADDRIRPQHLAELRRLLDSELTNTPRVFLLDTLMPPPRRGEEPTLVTHARLFRRDAGLRWTGRVHERLTMPNSAADQSIFSDIQIEHIGYLNPAKHEAKVRRNLRLLRMDYTVDPTDPKTLLRLAMTLLTRNRDAAKRYLLQIIAMDLGTSTIVQQAYVLVSELALAEGQFCQAAEFAERGLRFFPDDERLMFTRGAASFSIADYATASLKLEQILRQEPVRRIHCGTPAYIHEKLAPRMLSSVLRLQQDYRRAERILQSLVARFPDDAISWYELGLLYLDEARLADFSAVVRRLLSLPEGAFEAGLLTALWYLRHNDPAPAGPIIDQLIDEAPRRLQPRMLRAEWLSRVGAPTESQIRALHDVLRIEPGNREANHWLQEIRQAPRAPSQAVLTSMVAPFTIDPGLALQ